MTDPTQPTTGNLFLRLAPDELLTFIRHMRADHTDQLPYRLGDCPTCFTATLRWLNSGVLTVDEILAAWRGQQPDPDEPLAGPAALGALAAMGADGSVTVTTSRDPDGQLVTNVHTSPPTGPDRAAALQESWDRSWAEALDLAQTIRGPQPVASAANVPTAPSQSFSSYWYWYDPQTRTVSDTPNHLHVHTTPAGPPVRPAGTGDVLDTVDDQGRMLCACGCREPITDRSPSAYFASQQCSEAWHEDRLTGADHAMLSRPDAGVSDMYYVMPDRTRHPVISDMLGRHLEQRTARRRALRPAVHRADDGNLPAAAWLLQVAALHTRRAVVTHEPGDHGEQARVTIPPAVSANTDGWRLRSLAYRRFCTPCNAFVPPATTSVAPPGQTVHFRQVDQTCPHCNTPFGGRPMLGHTEADPHRPGVARLILEDGVAVAAAELTVNPRDDADTLLNRTVAAWTGLERQLNAFSSSYRPPAAPAPAPGDDRPYHLDVPPPPNFRALPPWRTAAG